jgi:hypothetical protein
MMEVKLLQLISFLEMRVEHKTSTRLLQHMMALAELIH